MLRRVSFIAYWKKITGYSKITLPLLCPVVGKEKKIMTTATKINRQTEEKITALYCRLSVDDDNKNEESNSITNQDGICQGVFLQKLQITQSYTQIQLEQFL